MKKTNSIEYGGKLLMVVIIPLMLIPIGLFCVYKMSGLSVFLLICQISLAVGCLLAVLLFAFLVVELNQDKRINKFYAKNKRRKLPIGNNQYECQYCGNKRLKASDVSCNICGIKFINHEDARNE